MGEEVKKEVKEDKKWNFKKNITGRDRVESLPMNLKMLMQSHVKMLGQCSEPKMSYSEVVDLPIREFSKIMSDFSKEIGASNKFDFLLTK